MILMEFIGTTLPTNIPTARREYSRSVYQRANVVILLYLIIILIVSLGRTDIGKIIAGTPLVALCLILLTPQILLSYETWNWWKVSSLQRKFGKYSGTYETGDAALIVKRFLIQEVCISRHGDLNRQSSFNHLFHLFRIMDFWKYSRRTLFEQAGVFTETCDD
jgi:hypothetical protein